MTRRFLVVAALLVVGSCCAAVGGYYGWRWYAAVPPQEPPAVDLTKAEPLVAHVIQKALTAVRDKPNSAEAWGHLGLVLRAHAYDDESNVCFAQAERLDPNDPRWPYLQGLQLRFREPDTALRHMERAANLCERYAPDKTVPRLLFAEMLLDRGRVGEAEERFRKILEREPQNEEANYDLGLAALARDDLKECVRYLTPLAESPTARKKVASQLAIVYSRLEDKLQAAKYMQRTRDLPNDQPWFDPFMADYQALDVGRLSRLQHVKELEPVEGSLSERLQILRQLVEDFPNDHHARLTLGTTLAMAGDYAAAERVLREAVRLAPDEMQAHYDLSMLLFFQAEMLRERGGDRDKAREKYREAAAAAGRATEIKPDNSYAYVLRGKALRRLGEQAEAVKALRRAVLCRPEMAAWHQLLGAALADDGQDGEALAELQIALELANQEPGVAKAAAERYAQVLLRAFLPVFP